MDEGLRPLSDFRKAIMEGALTMSGTTQGITKQQVDAAMEFLGMHNPKPDIPLIETVSGHQIVATARAIRDLQVRLAAMEKAVQLIIKDATA